MSVGTLSKAYLLPTVQAGRPLASAPLAVILTLAGLITATVETSPVGEIAKIALAPASATYVIPLAVAVAYGWVSLMPE